MKAMKKLLLKEISKRYKILRLVTKIIIKKHITTNNKNSLFIKKIINNKKYMMEIKSLLLNKIVKIKKKMIKIIIIE